MDMILGVAATFVLVVSTGSAFASSEHIATGPSRPINSTLQTRNTGSQAYPTFNGVELLTRSNVSAQTGGSQAYQYFAGQSALNDADGHRFALGTASELRFELIGPPQKNGGIGKIHQVNSESLVFVRLVRNEDGSPVTDAKVDLLRVDMARDGMGEMTARSYVNSTGEPGTYRVEIHPLMAGRWGLTLAAQASREVEPARRF